MLGDLIKALDLLLSTLRAGHTAERKRQRLAKELFQLYLDLRTVIERGRKILDLAPRSRTSDVSSEQGRVSMTEAVALLMLQTDALASLTDRLRTGLLGDILQLHAPQVSQELRCLLDAKNYRVWMTLDFLVTEGGPSTTEVLPGSQHNSVEEDWILRLEARMSDEGTHPFRDGQVYPLRVQKGVYTLKRAVEEAAHRPPGSIEADLVVTRAEITTGRKLLDDIESNTNELGAFLKAKFELSDLL